jgi:repressor of nif and glnA expression
METIKAERLVRKFYKMMQARKLEKAEIHDGVQLYKSHFCDIGFKTNKPPHMKRGSVVMQVSRIPDKEIMINVTVYQSADDFKKWLDYQVL